MENLSLFLSRVLWRRGVVVALVVVMSVTVALTAACGDDSSDTADSGSGGDSSSTAGGDSSSGSGDGGSDSSSTAGGDSSSGSGDGGSDSSSTTGDGSDDGGDSDGIFRIGIPSDITSTNAWDIIGPNTTTYNFAVFLNRYPTLMAYSDQRFDWVPDLADGLPGDVMQEADGSYSVTAKVRPGVKWSDGEAIDANDIAFTVNTALKLELTGGWQESINRDFVTSAEAVDDLTIKYTFSKEPGLAIWQFGLAQAATLPEHYWGPIVDGIIAANPDNLDDQRTALFTAGDIAEEPSGGPANYDRYDQAAFVSLVRNDDSYLHDSTVILYENGAYQETILGETEVFYGDATGDERLTVEREFDPETTIFSIYESQDAAILALRDGEIDYFLSPLGLSVGLQQQVTSAEGVTTFQNPSNGFRYLAFNTTVAPGNDPAFREAIATLIDKEFLATSVLQGAVSPIYSTVPEGNGFWYKDDVTQTGSGLSREDRINRVIELLTAAGYTWETQPSWNADERRVDEGSGLRGPDGELIEDFEILSPSQGYDPLRATSAIWIEQWLDQAGIPTTARLTGFNEIVDRVFVQEGRNFDAWILGWGLTPYPDHLVQFFTESQADVGGNNAGGYINPEFEALAARFLATTDVDEARELVFEMQEFIAKDLPYITLFATPIREAYRSSVLSFDYTEVLDGVQNTFQGNTGPIATASFN